MFTILQIIITVVVIYLIFSVMVYVIVEGISTMFQLRGKTLYRSIVTFYNDHSLSLGDLIYKHPQVSRLRRDKDRLPAYLPSANVAAAIIDIVGSKSGSQTTESKSIPASFEHFLEGLDKLPEGDLKRLLSSIAQKTDNIQALTASMEKWFNESMDRVTGWYKNRIRWIVMVVSLGITLSFNVDTVYILQAVRVDPVLRQRINDLGDKLLAERQVDSTNIELQQRTKQWEQMNALVQDADLPVGWEIRRRNTLWMYVGWLITALALTFGGPFWFDVLKRLVNIRSTGPKPGE